ncbi:carbohydrate ABC transporter permease [Paenibacillus qinlingensis]|uniref:ABC-type glycerol-3-phosphate transport system permease component n=1 Tax=Paenibacillus qinlingensis TaxID=1837343 RepID=A0ABU1NNQ7_9BACL|nr:carbohydrate ABC transporter permease [Paenibacillus qinlingensis]MDR6549114.1 ABC-type glycerol-3-phosphate transport system permease component [Paenibacillus qinlingensis]
MATLVQQFRRMTWSELVLLIILLLTAAFLSLPIVFIVNHAFKPFSELFAFPPTFIVKQPTLSNFYELFQRTSTGAVPFTRYLFNSIIVVIFTLVAVIVSSCMAAYVLSKHKFMFKAIIMGVIMLALMYAPETVAIPRYLMISWLNINNTYLGHILPFVASPVAVFLMKQFIDQIPNELLEAAKIDGASELRIFFKMVVPLSFPAVATISIITIQGVWGDTQASTLFMQDETMKTLPYYITTLTTAAAGGNTIAGQGMAAAAGLLMFLPNLFVFLAFQKRIMETMLHSGVK